MKHYPHGYTWFEVMGAGIIAGVLFFGVAMMMEPLERVREARDEARMRDLDVVQRGLVELRFTDIVTYEALLGVLGKERWVIGTGEVCGRMIKDVDAEGVCGAVQEHCVDAYGLGLREVLGVMPVDERVEGASQEMTGYYLERRGDALVVGACGVESREELEVVSEVPGELVGVFE